MSAQEQTYPDIRSLLIPLGGASLLLPSSAVAEVVVYVEPECVDGGPDWLLGNIQWRDQNVPVVSFPNLLGTQDTDTSPGRRAHIAVCNTINGSRDLPFVAVVCTAVPRMFRVNPETVEPVETEPNDPPVVLKRAEASGEPVIVPNLDALEELVRGAVGASP